MIAFVSNVIMIRITLWMKQHSCVKSRLMMMIIILQVAQMDNLWIILVTLAKIVQQIALNAQL